MRAAVTLVFVLLTALLGWWLYGEATRPWVEVLGSPPGENVRRDVLARLPDGDSVDVGMTLELLRVRTAGGGDLSIEIAEGTFEPERITPERTWDRPGVQAMLVNSVDELHRNNGGISLRIAAGCGLERLEGDAAQIGEVVITPCAGAYSDQGVTRVANAAVVIWEGDAERPRCGREHGADAYRTCISGTIESALEDLVRRLPTAGSPDVLIVPALGTGTGGLPMEDFYQVVSDVLTASIQNEASSAALPRRIVLHVWHRWSPDEWRRARSALANLATRITDYWTIESSGLRSTTTPANLLGVAGALTLVLLTGLVRRDLADRLVPLPLEEDPRSAAQLLLGWFIGAFGTLSLARALPIESLLSSSIWSEVLLGAVCVPLVVLALRGRRSLGDTV